MDRHLPPAGNWTLAQRAVRMKPSALRELLKVAECPDIISFAGGLPSPLALPAAPLREAAARILRDDAIAGLQYGPSEGFTPLRETIAAWHSRAGQRIAVEQVIITTGSQQGLDLVARVLVDPGSKVLVESPTYLGAVQALAQYEPRFAQVPIDAQGLLPSALDEAMLSDARLLYTQPNFQNPTGRSLSAQRRAELVRRVRGRGVMLIEDDPYGELSYGAPVPPSLLSMAPEQVVYLGSFSKVLAPGMRVGYLVAPEELAIKLVQAKQASDLHTAGLMQRLVHEVFTDGFRGRHVAGLRERYRRQCATMLASLARHMPDGVTWTRPTGGMFLWLTLPKGLDSARLFHDAIEAGVAFVPGASFYPLAARHDTLRLSFTTASPEQIEDGVARLAEVVRLHLQRGQ